MLEDRKEQIRLQTSDISNINGHRKIPSKNSAQLVELEGKIDNHVIGYSRIFQNEM